MSEIPDFDDAIILFISIFVIVCHAIGFIIPQVFEIISFCLRVVCGVELLAIFIYLLTLAVTRTPK